MGWNPFKKKATKTNQNTIQSNSIINTNLIQSIGSYSASYIKLSGNNKVQNDDLLIDYFNTLSEVSAPIRKYSDQKKNINLEYFSGNGDRIEDHFTKVVDRFWNTSAELFVIYDLLLGNSYIQGFESGSVETKGTNTLTDLYVLPSEFTNIDLKDITQDFRNVEISKYVVDISGDYKELSFLPEEILHIKQSSTYTYSDNNVYGLSRLVNCEKNIQSIASGYGAKIALYDNGPRVIITGKSQGEFASMSTTEGTEEVQKRVNDTYGRTDGQFQILLTDIPLDVSTISLNVAELKLNENNASDFRRICNSYNQDSKIHGDPEATTYDNMNTALSDFYNSSLKSYYNDRIKKINDFVNKWAPDLIIKADYSNIKEISEHERNNEALLFEKAAKGLITRNEYLEQINEATVNLPEFKQYYVYGNDGKWYPVTQITETNQGTEQDIGQDNGQ